MHASTSDTMTGRVCVITGANRGLGRATALGLARLGATVVLLCRDAERCARARDEIRRESGSERVSSVVTDLASLASVRAAAADVARRHSAVHVLVNNAGVNRLRRGSSADGVEMTFAVNHLGPFLLTNLLLPRLRGGAPSRIITVTSRFERWALGLPDAERGGRWYNGLAAYTRSKRANVLFTYELADRLRGTGVTANCVHPGLVATDLMRDWPRWLRGVWERFLLTPEEGARPVIRLASDPALADVTGAYFERDHIARSSRGSYDAAARTRLWRLSAELTGIGG